MISAILYRRNLTVSPGPEMMIAQKYRRCQGSRCRVVPSAPERRLVKYRQRRHQTGTTTIDDHKMEKKMAVHILAATPCDQQSVFSTFSKSFVEVPWGFRGAPI